MTWQQFPLTIKTALILMLINACIPIIASVTFSQVLKKSPPIFIHLLSVIWIALFLVSFKNLRYALIGAIIWGIIQSIGSMIPILKGVCPLPYLGLPICPFPAIGIVISLIMVFLCLKNL